MKRNRSTLKSYFETGDYPNEAQFADLIDSFLSVSEDDASIGNISITMNSFSDGKSFSVYAPGSSSYISMDSNGWSILGNTSANDGQDSHLIIKRNGGLEFNDNGSVYKVWHAGNDGNGSGLNADLLDGMSWGNVNSDIITSGKLRSSEAFALNNRTTEDDNFSIRSYDNSDTDITSAVNGSTAGVLIENQIYGHTVVGLRSNDDNDSFSIIANSTGEFASYSSRIAGFKRTQIQLDKPTSVNANKFQVSNGNHLFTTDGRLHDFCSNGNTVLRLFNNSTNTGSRWEILKPYNGGLSFSFHDGTSAKAAIVAETDGDVAIYKNLNVKGDVIQGDAKNIIQFRDSDGWLRLNPSGNFNSGIYCGNTGVLRHDNRIEVGGGGSAFRVDINGTGFFSGNVTADNFVLSSDERLKKGVEDLATGSVNVQWKSFYLKNEPAKRFGVIAQELEQTNPEFVRTDEKGLKSVAYIDLLVAKMAEKDQQIDQLINRLMQLEASFKKLSETL
ncbi:tail fiber domain-containing protein [Muricauda oceani]|uniref:Tail fiber domain-containing protein n=1 Tax=Flagellimonas oceani TaxID=2698672 RepID=A0A6G7J615_9FLAO|nr:tail fiber domain-containing protein [Allomuricauda oceani]MBW8242515.1 tail fiber domain-containing protein [Allomuricauda oceani]QII46275.1 tail fiber domain-containing protein [Allomuricauda oceani]